MSSLSSESGWEPQAEFRSLSDVCKSSVYRSERSSMDCGDSESAIHAMTLLKVLKKK